MKTRQPASGTLKPISAVEGLATSRKKNKGPHNEDLPFTHLKERKPILNRVTFLPQNIQQLLEHGRSTKPVLLQTFSSLQGSKGGVSERQINLGSQSKPEKPSVEDTLDQFIREKTPKQIRVRLKKEGMKDAKLNFCSVKTLMYKRDQEEVKSLERWENGETQTLPRVQLEGRSSSVTQLQLTNSESQAIAQKKYQSQFNRRKVSYATLDPYKTDPRLSQRTINTQRYNQQILQEQQAFRPSRSILNNYKLKDNILIGNAFKKLDSILRHKQEHTNKSQQIPGIPSRLLTSQQKSDEKEKLANKEVFLEFKKQSLQQQIDLLTAEQVKLRANSNLLKHDNLMLKPVSSLSLFNNPFQKIDTVNYDLSLREAKVQEYDCLSPVQRYKPNNIKEYKENLSQRDFLQQQLEAMRMKISSNTITANQNNQRMSQIESELQGIKSLQQLVKDEQIHYYQSLLIEGADCRDYGLSWLIKSLWLLGKEVPVSLMPHFLDRKAIHYLFNVSNTPQHQYFQQMQCAKTELEMEEMFKHIKQLREQKNAVFHSPDNSSAQTVLRELEESQQLRNTSCFSQIESTRDMIDQLYTDRERQLPLVHSKHKILDGTNLQITDLCNTSTIVPKKERDSQKQAYAEFFSSMVQSDYGSPRAKSNLQVTHKGELVPVPTHSNFSDRPQLGAISILRIIISEKKLLESEQIVKKHKEHIKVMKGEEADRINKEFRLNRYGKRFETSVEVVLRALFGDKDKHKFLPRNANIF